MNGKTDFIIIGAAILDILAQPVNSDVFVTGSQAAGQISMSTGGDALNEATVLAALGASVRLVSKIGQDSAGRHIRRHCQTCGIEPTFIIEDSSLDTSINIVLVDQAGERHFITSPRGTLRKLYPKDISDASLARGKYLCFASIFVAPAFDNLALKRLFERAKAQGLILCADMTKCKNKETLSDVKESLALLDYIFPNYEEARLLTGLSDWDEIADAFLSCGVKNVVVKAGKRGCFIKNSSERYWIPAFPNAKCIDTTGAGDTFTACFLYALNQGFSLPDCGRFANAGASVCIEHLRATGTIESAGQVMERFHQINTQNAADS